MTTQTCTRCVMDTSDPGISFDVGGVCNHCHDYDRNVANLVRSGPAAAAALAATVGEIRKDGLGRDYDCVIGISGGVDSTYLAWKIKDLGLRPLAVHLDNGWNSELAVKNIELALKRLGIDLHTMVLDWDEFRDLQLAFLRASIPDCEIPTDHAIVATMSGMARRFGVRHVISGMNVRTESHLPRAWSQGHLDWRYISAVHRRFGTRPLRTFPHQGILTLAWNQIRLRVHAPLNLLDYRKDTAIRFLQDNLGWTYYGGKHYESLYTRWYQGYLLPGKFGFDKRRTHLSSLVCSGEMTRDQALDELAKEAYPRDLQRQDTDYVCKKLGLGDAEFKALFSTPPHRFEDYPSYATAWWFTYARRAYRRLRRDQ